MVYSLGMYGILTGHVYLLTIYGTCWPCTELAGPVQYLLGLYGTVPAGPVWYSTCWVCLAEVVYSVHVLISVYTEEWLIQSNL